MLKTGLSHGVAIMPNAPKERYSDPITGAHFEYSDMCARLERMAKKRYLDNIKAEKKALAKDFMIEKKLKEVEVAEFVDKTEKIPVEQEAPEQQLIKETRGPM